jgi:hypothetical protein
MLTGITLNPCALTAPVESRTMKRAVTVLNGAVLRSEIIVASSHHSAIYRHVAMLVIALVSEADATYRTAAAWSSPIWFNPPVLDHG